MTYQTPLADMRFVLEHVAGLETVAGLPGHEEAGADLAAAILDEAGKFAAGILAPLDRVGDAHGCGFEGGQVRTPDGWNDAYRRFCEGGWVGLGLPEEIGGQGLPKLISAAVGEIWAASNLAFSLAPQANFGAASALVLAADESIRTMFLPKLVSGEWAGTMNLTEPQAGSDLAAIRTRAEPCADGSYRLFGQKIFITYGEHEMTENIVHLVLARTPDAPPGVKGISMFVVPKFLVGGDGRLGARNDVRCVAIEHKLGLHGSPTCTMSYGDEDGAVGYLVGETGRGLETMFVMMNEMRFGVGLQGVALAERAYQKAVRYARERVQGRLPGGREPVAIIRHPDVKRMLLTLRAKLMAARMLTYSAAAWFDIAERHSDAAVADKHRRLVDLLTPVIKGWCTEVGIEACDLAVQIHGGAGFVEETGIARHFRDARVTTIYEGTTGIQAGDLMGRKILREQGATLRLLLDEMHATCVTLDAQGFGTLAAGLRAAAAEVAAVLDWALARGGERQVEVLAGAVPVLRMLGLVCGAWQLGRAAAAVRQGACADDAAYGEGIVGMANFYFAHLLPQASAWGRAAMDSAAACLEFDEDKF